MNPPLNHPIYKRWRPSTLIRVSVVLHIGAAAAMIARPQLWPWMMGSVIANHLLLTAAGLWPRSKILGPNWTRLPSRVASVGGVAITFDDGPDPAVTPRVLTLLDEYAAKATFFCIGELVEQHAELAREIVRRGHTIENHSQRHLHRFSVLGPRGLANEIERAQEAIGTVTGERPRFFRAPAGLRSPFLDPVLTRLDLQLASWTRRGFDTVNQSPDSVFEKLARNLRGGDILLLHDGNGARTQSGSPVIFEVLPRLLASLASAKLRTVTLRSALI
jgi:peptidoglycan/xylan/chitin deacetylase (PgdA/CDA1 family)